MKRFPRSRLSSVCVVLALAAAACVQPGAPTVGMSKVEASLVFGLAEVSEPVMTPIETAVAQVLAAPAPAETETETVEEEVPFEFAKPAVPKFAPFVARPPAEPCPEAPVTAAALDPALPRVTGDPRLGASDWYFKGFGTLKTGPEPERLELEGFSRRSIRNFNRTSPDLFTFEQVEVSGENVIVRTYEVNQKPIAVNPSDGVGTIATPGVGEPERGIVLTKIEVLNSAGQPQPGGFNPAVGLLLLPLPVVAGEKFVSTAVDVRTGSTMSHEATVLERQRVDACGDLVDGWGVEYQRKDTRDVIGGSVYAAQHSTKYTMVFATQYGGAPILERVAIEEPSACNVCPFEVTTRLGQFEPDPLKP